MSSPPGTQGTLHDPTAETVVLVYRLCMGRTPSAEEVEAHRRSLSQGAFQNFLRNMYESPEARDYRAAQTLSPAETNADFVQRVYQTTLGRGALPWEIRIWQGRLERGELSRAELLSAFFNDMPGLEELASAAPHDSSSQRCHILGSEEVVTRDDWEKLRNDSRERRSRCIAEPTYHRFPTRISDGGPPLVSAIASLYRGGAFIERFLENITSQRGFHEFCELIIVDANSPDGEHEVIERYRRAHPNISYVRLNVRIGIYEAWNLGIELAQGAYLTNTNVDDLRRHDSFELQASTLDNVPFADVVYQDFYYTFDSDLSFDEVAAVGIKSTLPQISFHNLMSFNSPHNAPMWRRTLHHELGLFDGGYRSGGDQEFWMRCLAAGKTFFKISDPHVAYFQNPRGVSTRSDTLGPEEFKRALRRHSRRLIPEAVKKSTTEFLEELRGLTGQDCEAPTRYLSVQRALRFLASARPIPQRREFSAGGRATRPVRIVVDGVAFMPPNDPLAEWWDSLLRGLSELDVDVILLDRGGAPAIDGIKVMPFPAIAAAQRGPEDSRLLQKVCDLVHADVFVSTLNTTPLSIPSLCVIPARELFRTRTCARAELEAEVATLHADFVLSDLEKAAGPHPVDCPKPGDRDAGAISATKLAECAVAVGGGESNAERNGFFTRWRRLREIQAAVDFQPAETLSEPGQPGRRSFEPTERAQPSGNSEARTGLEQRHGTTIRSPRFPSTIEEWRDRVSRMEASRSWRYTRPLRVVGDLFRRLSR